MANNTQWILDELCRILSILSSSPDEQISYLQSISIGESQIVDELALEFDDVYVLTPQLIEQGTITQQQHTAILSLDRKLKEMSGSQNAHLWTTESIRQGQYWREVRELASIAKAVLECNERLF